MEVLAANLRIPVFLGEFGIREEHLPELDHVVTKVTMPLDNKPRELGVTDAEKSCGRVL